MSNVKKQFSISLDAKRSTSNRDFEVVDGDNGNVLELELTDDGIPVDLEGCFILAVFSKSNGKTAAQDNQGNGITVDPDQSNLLYIELYTTSFAPGLVECELEIYSGEDKRTLITTAKFNFMCRRGIANRDTIAQTDEWPVLVEMLERIDTTEEELILLNEETAQAAATAHSAAQRANEAAFIGESQNALFETDEIQRKQNEVLRKAAEVARVNAENVREQAEELRLLEEDGRIIAEQNRVEDETKRNEAEQARKTAEQARLTAETERIQSEQERKQFHNAVKLFEEYDNSKDYVAHNKVSFGGSSYHCLSPVRGVAPPNPNYWLLIAARGADGMGSGDMLRETYDKNASGVVDDAERLGGRLAEEFLSASEVYPWARAAQKPEYTAEEIGAPPLTHAFNHATGGEDEISPSDIGAAYPARAYSASLTAQGWLDDEQSIEIEGVTPESLLIISPAPACLKEYGAAGIKANTQGEGTISFSADETPENDLDVQVLIVR